MSPSKTSTVEWDKFYNIVGTEKRGSDNIHHGVNPVTGEELWDVPVATEQDLNDAVAAAKKAFPAWRDTPLEKRKEILMKLCDHLGPHVEDIITLLCKETGKPVCCISSQKYDPADSPQRKFATIEVHSVLLFIQYHCAYICSSPRIPN